MLRGEIQESEKAGSHQEGHLVCTASALPLNYNNRTTTILRQSSLAGQTLARGVWPARLYRLYSSLSSIFHLKTSKHHICLREAVFSPNPMWYRPTWSCDFRCNLHGLQSSGIGHTGDRVTLARIYGGPRLDSCSMGLANYSFSIST